MRSNRVIGAIFRPRAAGGWVPGSVDGPAGTRSYLVYVPAGLASRSRVPLVVLLHGCKQTATEFAAATGFNALADLHRFVVVYPQQSTWSHQQGCWRWYESGHQRRGAGEPAILAQITAAVAGETARWRIDPRKVYVAGLSAGGGMALILAATYPDVYAAAGVHSAPAYRSAANGLGAAAAMAGRAVPPPRRPADGGRAMAPVIVFQGAADTTVRPASGRRITEQWLAYAGETRPGEEVRRTAGGRSCVVTRWPQLEHWLVDGLAHAWSGGAAGGSFSDPDGPSASAAMWDFFAGRRAGRRAGGKAGRLRIRRRRPGR
ncbi:PHB depolymerase family esterase [Actinoplanes sp. NPDC026619]|uniref:extracellular catalytic domain type 1 short-chain-length polyhydroxyalkanoate depolymerase n=1 Tax=Actinoplanes sp. NPDC026619 TaxID=3155798 RepID=UPI0033D15854